MQIPHTHLTTTHSTNSELIAWVIDSFDKSFDKNAQNNDNHQMHFSRPHLLTADRQTSGRGQHGRTWQSPIGNVYFSLYIPTQKFSKNQHFFIKTPIDGRLSLAIALALVKMPIIQQINTTLKSQNLPTIGVKWVNDVGFYQNAQFQKLSGILIEPANHQGKMLGIVIGIGLNVHKPPVLTQITQETLNYQAISLANFLTQPIELNEIYEMMITACYKAICQFNEFYNKVFFNNFLIEFSQFDVLKDKNLLINLPNTLPNNQKTGQAVGIDNNGCLLVCTKNQQIEPIWTGTIHILPNN